MARLDCYRVDGTLVLDVQALDLGSLATRVVAPLIPLSELKPIAGLNPVFELQGQAYVLATQGLAAVPMAELGEAVMSLGEAQDHVVTKALDYLLSWSR
jgi:toxin CcdB